MFPEGFGERLRVFYGIARSKWMGPSVYAMCTFMGFVFVYLVSDIALGSFLKLSTLVSFSCFLLGNSMYQLNDLFDVGIDAKNERDKPITEGDVSKRDVTLTSAVLGAGALVLLGFTNIETFAIGLFCLILGIGYSVPPIRLKDRLWGKTTTITSIIILSIVISGFSLGKGIYPLSFMALSIGIFVELVAHSHDIRDMEGDRNDGCKTLPMILGERPTIALAAVGYVTLVIFAMVGFYLLNLNVLLPISAFFLSLLGFRKIKTVWSSQVSLGEYESLRVANRMSIISYASLFLLGAL